MLHHLDVLLLGTRSHRSRAKAFVTRPTPLVQCMQQRQPVCLAGWRLLAFAKSSGLARVFAFDANFACRTRTRSKPPEAPRKYPGQPQSRQALKAPRRLLRPTPKMATRWIPRAGKPNPWQKREAPQPSGSRQVSFHGKPNPRIEIQESTKPASCCRNSRWIKEKPASSMGSRGCESAAEPSTTWSGK